MQWEKIRQGILWCKNSAGTAVGGEKEMTLREVKPGTTVIVKQISGSGAYKRRIMDMGITKNSELFVRKVAPLGDPVELTVRGYELSVRKDDADCIEVENA